MASEARRGLIRIASNYARLLAAVIMGIILVPLWLAWLGNDGFALLMLIAASVGLASMLQDVMRHSMVRELGAAWHADDPARFPNVYASSFVICAAVAVLTAAIFVVFILAVPVLEMPEAFRTPARWVLAAEGVWTCLLILLSPAFNMYVVTERFAAHNFWTAALRSAQLIATLVLFLGVGLRDPYLGLTWYGIVTAALSAIMLLIAVAIIAVRDRRLRPRPGRVTRAALGEVAGTFGWNSAVVLAMNLHERIGALIMNKVFGLWGNTVYGLALRLVSYVRMLTLGMTFGLDAVSARLSAGPDRELLRSVVRHATRLHGFVALPAAFGVLLLTEPLLRLWVGRYVEDPDPDTGLAVLASANVLVRIMVVGMASRAIADGWMKLLYGAGHIRRYAPLILAGGIANPVLALVLIQLLPDDVSYTGVAWAFSAAFLVVHLGLLPFVAARALATTWRDMMSPLLRPAILAAAPCVILVMPTLSGAAASITWPQLVTMVVAYGAIYVTLGFLFGLSARERKRLIALARGRRAAPVTEISDSDSSVP